MGKARGVVGNHCAQLGIGLGNPLLMLLPTVPVPAKEESHHRTHEKKVVEDTRPGHAIWNGAIHHKL